MLDEKHIIEFLDGGEIPVSGSLIKEPGTNNQYTAFIIIKRDDENKQIPSNRKLKEASSELLKLGVKVEFLLKDTLTQDIEIGLRATLLHSHGEDLRNVYLSTSGNTAHVWLDQKRAFDNTVLKMIEKRVKTYLEQFSLSLASMPNLSGNNLPGILACLKVIRYTAPVDVDSLFDQLHSRKFTIPSKDWLARRLDTMRRSGRIVRLDNGNYVLSLESIRNLGTKKGRMSPDITRMLALVRRS